MKIWIESGAPYDGQNPSLIGYQSVATAATVSADSTAAGYAVENVTDGYTWDFWRPGLVSDASISITTEAPVTVDYLAIAAHTIPAGCTSVTLEYTNDADAIETVYTVDAVDVEAGPLLIHFAPRTSTEFRVWFNGLNNADDGLPDLRIGVLHLGTLLQMPQAEYEGFQDPTLRRQSERTPNTSDGGNYLGMIVTRQFRNGSPSWDHLPPDWYREYFEPFVEASETGTFFLAWRPADFPSDLVYGWRTDDVQPTNTGPTGLMSASFSMQAVSNG